MDSNFVDYVKIMVRSGHGGQGRGTSDVKNFHQKVDLTVAMAVVEDILYFAGISKCGHCFI